MDRTAQLLARLEIEALNVEFAYRIDPGRAAEVAELFTPDGSYGRSPGERSTGGDAIRTAYAQRAERGPRTARHVFSNLRLTFHGEDEAAGQSILTLYAADGLPPHPAEVFLVADYDDVYRRGDNGRWLFASRTITWLFVAKDGKFSPLPLGGVTKA